MTAYLTFKQRRGGFSLVEVALALGLTSFALFALLGLFSMGLRDLDGSQRNVEAANVLSTVLETRLAAPAGTSSRDALPALVAGSLPLKGTTYLSSTGQKVPPAQAHFRLTYEIWEAPATTPGSAPRLVRTHLFLSWPARVEPAEAADSAELLTSAYVKL